MASFDSKLYQRIKESLRPSEIAGFIDVESLSNRLQTTYRLDYSRKKRIPFRNKVAVICGKLRRESVHEMDAVVEPTTSSEAGDHIGSSCQEPKNCMNASITEMYMTSTPSQNAPVVTSSKDERAVLTAPAHRLNNNVSSSRGQVQCVVSANSRSASLGSTLRDANIDWNTPLKLPGSARDRDPESGHGHRKKKRRNGSAVGGANAGSVDTAIESAVVDRVQDGHSSWDFRVSATRFTDLGGFEKHFEMIRRLLMHMSHPEVYQVLGVLPPVGVLLHGPPGSGKTLLAEAISGELGLPMLKLASTEVVSGVSGESEGKLRSVFETARAKAPCILFLDEIDAITPKRESAGREMERRIVSQLLACMDDLFRDRNSRILVIGATNRPDSLDPALRRAGRFDKEISLGIPDVHARESILRIVCSKLRLQEQFDFHHLATLTPGYVGADLEALTREAALHAVIRVIDEVGIPTVNHRADALVGAVNREDAEATNGDLPDYVVGVFALPPFLDQESSDKKAVIRCGENEAGSDDPMADHEGSNVFSVYGAYKDKIPSEILAKICINDSDFLLGLRDIQPSAKREGFITVPDTLWSDVGALEDIREELSFAILAAVRNPALFEQLGLRSSSGILLAGPPGCGKTLLAKAVANEAGINFISVKGPELLNMYVGESERAVRQCFQRARNSVPCVIFFDELDSLCPRRSGGDSGASVRVVNQLLTEMDGLVSRENVFVLGATNRPDIIDPAVLRPGRFDKVICIDLPNSESRFKIFLAITNNRTRPLLGDDVDLHAISGPLTDGFTGADLSALVREAATCCLKEAVQLGYATSSRVVVSSAHFDFALTRVKRSVSCEDSLLYNAMKEKYSI